MKNFKKRLFRLSLVTGLPVLAISNVSATEPCDDFGECKVLIEINSSDGDIGFHFLMDGDDLNMARIFDAEGRKVFEDQAKGPLKEQKLTETFAESAEPLCWSDPEADEDEEIVYLEEFLERWPAGYYLFEGHSDGGEKSFGATMLTYHLPAAPAEVDFDGTVISWEAGVDLGNCANNEAGHENNVLGDLIADGIIPDPANVDVASWEVVMEPDVEDGDPVGALKYTIRVDGRISPMEVSVPSEYLASLPTDTPVKIEVGAIGVDDNATFTEEDGFCVNVGEGCEED
ncbi:MAG: hypothetical protein KJN90_13945 [Gammaproteobacteria bacterium]|nr:hypothetical protein [Gammaproteobacteria bacterium]